MFSFLVFNTEKPLDKDVILATVCKYLPDTSILYCTEEVCQLMYNETEMTFSDMLSRHYFVPEDNWYLSCYMHILKDLGVESTGYIATYTLESQRILNTSKTIVLTVDKNDYRSIKDALKDCSIQSINSDDLLSKSCIYVEYSDYMLSELTSKEDLTNYIEKFNSLLERQV